ncbi:hypothetical protein GY45DRAFT_1332615 [Cubamyces sp. BRFM 1775]|nr:hypothetical protein GY45DRAFT_1332615 [Cubamyces sp. BRFM 1775]
MSRLSRLLESSRLSSCRVVSMQATLSSRNDFLGMMLSPCLSPWPRHPVGWLVACLQAMLLGYPSSVSILSSILLIPPLSQELVA